MTGLWMLTFPQISSVFLSKTRGETKATGIVASSWPVLGYNIPKAMHLTWWSTFPERLNSDSALGMACALYYFTLEKEKKKLSDPGRTPYSSLKKKNFLSSSWKLVTTLSRKEGFRTAVPEWVRTLSLLDLKISSHPRPLKKETTYRAFETIIRNTSLTVLAGQSDLTDTRVRKCILRQQEPKGSAVADWTFDKIICFLTKALQEKVKLNKNRMKIK